MKLYTPLFNNIYDSLSYNLIIKLEKSVTVNFTYPFERKLFYGMMKISKEIHDKLGDPLRNELNII